MDDNEFKLLKDKISYLEKILYSIPGNIYWKDKEGKYLGCNKTMATIFGLSSPIDVINKKDEDLFAKELAVLAKDLDNRVMETKQEITTEELGLNQHGELANYQSTKVPLFKENQVVGIVGSSIDITARKRLEEQLKQAKIMAEEANEAKSEFLRNMSHDLRTPFNGLLNFSQFLESMEEDPEKKQFLHYIVMSAKQLYEIINQIFEVVKIEGSKLPIKSQPFYLRAMLDNIKQLVMPEIIHNELDFIIFVADDIPHQIISDEVRLHRIILNLVSNALRFTEVGKVTLEAKVLSKQHNKITLEISVSDTGSGIPPNKIDYIFGQFNRLSSAYKGQVEGIGLGLYIVKQLIKDLDGQIMVESQVGVGSKFSIVLTVLSNEILPRKSN